MTGEVSTGETTTVLVTGAYLTQPVSTTSSRERDGRVRTALVRLGEGQSGWGAGPSEGSPAGTYASGGGFSAPSPLVAAHCAGPAPLTVWQAELDDERALPPQRADVPWSAWQARATALRTEIYDFGVAVVVLTVQVTPPAGTPWAELASTVKRMFWLRPEPGAARLGAAVEALRAHSAATASAWSDALAGDVPRAVDRSAGTIDEGRLLWLHPVLTTTVAGHGDVPARVSAVAPAFHATIDVSGASFVPGIGWSAFVTIAPDVDTGMPRRLIELHWAYIALFMSLDRYLLGALEQVDVAATTSLAGLERSADHVFAQQMRVLRARARADSALADLGGDEQAVWDVLCAVTKFDALIGGVDRKVEALRALSDRRVQQATTAAGRRTTAILGGLTALTLVTVTVALIGNFLGSRSDEAGNLGLRILFVALALLLAAGVFWAAFREQTWRDRRRRDRSHRDG